MFNLKDFELYTTQSFDGKAILCWSKKLGYFFLEDGKKVLEDYKVIGVEK